jgi:hypothetical protein
MGATSTRKSRSRTLSRLPVGKWKIFGKIAKLPERFPAAYDSIFLSKIARPKTKQLYQINPAVDRFSRLAS